MKKLLTIFVVELMVYFLCASFNGSIIAADWTTEQQQYYWKCAAAAGLIVAFWAERNEG